MLTVISVPATPKHCSLRAILNVLTVLLFMQLQSCRLFSLGGSQSLREAEEQLRQNKYDAAIQSYKNHMQKREKVKDRPQWENPSFYYLLIGDIELGRGDPQKALEAYDTASKNNVHPSLISDRYRFVAAWYEENGDPMAALELLKKHREMDTLLFDAMMDRISKDIIRSQDGEKSTN